MIKNRRTLIGLITGILGLVITIIAYLLYPSNRVTDQESRMAFTQFFRIPLIRLMESESVATRVVIPNDQQWAHIRRIWGQPTYLIAVDSGPDLTGAKWALNINDLGIRVEISSMGKRIDLKRTSRPPYDYSTNSRNCCLEFRANPGDELEINVRSDRKHPIPGTLLLVSSWPNAKDLIVSTLIWEDLIKPLRVAIAVGIVLMVVGGIILVMGSRLGRQGTRPAEGM